jgi:hypothetical protein
MTLSFTPPCHVLTADYSLDTILLLCILVQSHWSCLQLEQIKLFSLERGNDLTVTLPSLRSTSPALSSHSPITAKIPGVTFDRHMSMDTQGSEICTASHYHLRLLGPIHSATTDEPTKTIAGALGWRHPGLPQRRLHGARRSEKVSQAYREQNAMAHVLI